VVDGCAIRHAFFSAHALTNDYPSSIHLSFASFHILISVSAQVYAEAFLATATSGSSSAKEAKEKAIRDEIKELYHKVSMKRLCFCLCLCNALHLKPHCTALHCM
jgi:hypothetical protein